jgi:hypothetical protein
VGGGMGDGERRENMLYSKYSNTKKSLQICRINVWLLSTLPRGRVHVRRGFGD